MAVIEDLVDITVEAPSGQAVVGQVNHIRGRVNIADRFGAPPFVYAEIQKKDWYKPEILEKTWHERGLPKLPEGDFDIEWIPDGTGHYEITVVTTPAPISLPMVGVFPITGKSASFKVEVGEQPPEELRIKNFKITRYGKGGGIPVYPPSRLDLEIGDTCRVYLEFEHLGPSISGKFHAAIWKKGIFDIHDEILNAEKYFSVPEVYEWQVYKDSIDIFVGKGEPDVSYGLYAKIMGVSGGDVFTPYYSGVISIAGAPTEPPAADIRNFDFMITKGTYQEGDTVPFTGPYEYKGPAQPGQLTISLGTGVYPSFYTKHTYPPSAVGFAASDGWSFNQLSGSIVIPPGLEPGQTYSVRARLEGLTEKTQEIDTDWSAFDLLAKPPSSDIRNIDFKVPKDTYRMGDNVNYIAHYEYKGPAQGGGLTISLGTGVYPSFFTKHTFLPIPVGFKESMDWQHYQLDGDFMLPSTLEPGQTYSVRARLETDDGAQETDTDWGAFKIEALPPQELRISDFRIDSYGRRGYPPMAPYNMVTLTKGDILRINVSFNYAGPAISGEFHGAIWQPSWWGDPHDEVLNAEKNFTAPQTELLTNYTDYIDIPITLIGKGTYGIYVKIMGITGGDIKSEYIANVITIV